jgi:hypothetical protein
MSNYKINLINTNSQVLDQYIELVDQKVLDPYKTEILRLPPDQQKSEWYKYTLINNMITQSIETVSMMHDQINTMHTAQEVAEMRLYITKLRAYIRDLGGNPSVINYILKTDL